MQWQQIASQPSRVFCQFPRKPELSCSFRLSYTSFQSQLLTDGVRELCYVRYYSTVFDQLEHTWQGPYMINRNTLLLERTYGLTCMFSAPCPTIFIQNEYGDLNPLLYLTDKNTYRSCHQLQKLLHPSWQICSHSTSLSTHRLGKWLWPTMVERRFTLYWAVISENQEN